MRLNDWRREAERFADIDREVLQKLYQDEPVPCPVCEGSMSIDGQYPVCPSCRAQADADRP